MVQLIIWKYHIIKDLKNVMLQWNYLNILIE